MLVDLDRDRVRQDPMDLGAGDPGVGANGAGDAGEAREHVVAGVERELGAEILGHDVVRACDGESP